MGSHGVRDKVAIVGMGCTKFAELWDKGLDDLIVDASTEAFASAGLQVQLRGAERFFERGEVKQAVGLLKVAGRSAGPDEEPEAQVRPILTGLIEVTGQSRRSKRRPIQATTLCKWPSGVTSGG